MRHPKNPFSPDRPANGAETEEGAAYDWRRDGQEAAAEGMPGDPGPAGGRTGGPAPLPRRTRDSGFRPDLTQAAGQDFWPLTAPEDAWPLVPRPQAGSQASRPAPASPEAWAEGGPEEPWAPPGHQEPWGQNGPREPRTHGEPDGPWTQGEPREPWTHGEPDGPWTQGEPREPWTHGEPDGPWTQGEPREPWMHGEPDGPWAEANLQEPLAAAQPAAQAQPAEPWAQDGPGDPWAQAGAPHSWSPPPPPYDGSRDYWDDAELQEPWPSGQEEAGPQQGGPQQGGPQQGGRPETGPQEPWLQAQAPPADPPGSPGSPGLAGLAGSADLAGLAGTADVPDWQEPPPPARNAGPPDLDEPWLRTAKPKSSRWRGRGGHPAPGPGDQGDLPPADGTHLLPAQGGPAGPDDDPAPSMESQELWESWEPPYNQAGAARQRVPNRTAPYPELVRDAEYEDELWRDPGLGGAGGDGPHYPGPRRRAAHARNTGRPRMSGAFLALAGALAIAGAIPLGILGIRTLHHGGAAEKTAPLSASHAAAAGQNGAGTFTALAGPGCPPGASAAAIPYHAPNGDGWHDGTASGSGPCGSGLAYSYLAMVPGNPGEWHDHYTWIFRTGMNNPSCSFSLYIPAAAQANSTDYYWFSAGDSNPDHRIADFSIDQATHQGQWVTKGPFTFPGGTVLIEATDRGGEGSPTASVAAGPARISC